MKKLSGMMVGVPTVAQWVKDPALPQVWPRSQLQLRFETWPRNFHMPWVHPKEKKKKKKKETFGGNGYIHLSKFSMDVNQLYFNLKSSLQYKV